MKRPRTVRARLLLAVMVSAALIIAVATVAFALVLAHALSDDADDVARLHLTAERAYIHVAGDRITVRGHAGSFDAQAWVLQGDRIISAPSSSSAISSAIIPFVRAGGEFRDVPGAHTRLGAAPITDQAHRRIGTAVVAISLLPFQGTQRVSITIWLVTAGLLLVGIFFGARWLIDSSLRPVALMTSAARAWSFEDPIDRFATGQPADELGELAVTLDGLLDRLSASLRREQLTSLELSHELRTPLARLCAEAEIALRREREPARYQKALEAILAGGQQMTRIVDALMMAARREASATRGTSDAGEIFGEVVDQCTALAAERAVHLEVGPLPAPAPVGIDCTFAARIVQPLVENALRFASSTVTLGASLADGRIALTVDDDGPGIDVGDRERIFEPGVRGDQAAAGQRESFGAGLGLALARRLARAVSGNVVVEERRRGSRFVVLLPAGFISSPPSSPGAGGQPDGPRRAAGGRT
jgi:signal transduction histidine kinase